MGCRPPWLGRSPIPSAVVFAHRDVDAVGDNEQNSGFLFVGPPNLPQARHCLAWLLGHGYTTRLEYFADEVAALAVYPNLTSVIGASLLKEGAAIIAANPSILDKAFTPSAKPSLASGTLPPTPFSSARSRLLVSVGGTLPLAVIPPTGGIILTIILLFPPIIIILLHPPPFSHKSRNPLPPSILTLGVGQWIKRKVVLSSLPSTLPRRIWSCMALAAVVMACPPHTTPSFILARCMCPLLALIRLPLWGHPFITPPVYMRQLGGRFLVDW